MLFKKNSRVFFIFLEAKWCSQEGVCESVFSLLVEYPFGLQHSRPKGTLTIGVRVRSHKQCEVMNLKGKVSHYMEKQLVNCLVNVYGGFPPAQH